MVVFIGTLHSNLTPHHELIKLIESFNPALLLVEIIQEDIGGNTVEKYPDEMRAVLTWATVKGIVLHGIDSGIKTVKEGTSDSDLKLLDREQTAITSKHDWKEFNKPEYYGALETETWQKIIDKTKDHERNLEMFSNISSQINRSDPVTTVVVIGSGHIPFFKSEFPDAHFPLS